MNLNRFHKNKIFYYNLMLPKILKAYLLLETYLPITKKTYICLTY